MRQWQAGLLLAWLPFLGCDRSADVPRDPQPLDEVKTGEQVLGCTCDYKSSLAELYDRYPVVLLGAVVDAHPIEPEPRHNQETSFRIYLKVLERFRGSPPEDLSASGTAIYHSPFEDSRVRGVCEPPFVLGKSYLIFTKGDTTLEFAPCSEQIQRARDDLIDELRRLAAGSSDAEL
ncbi:MAG: hypothetical protein AAGE43_01565 [Pseudomonadota bacterium]